MLGVADHLDAGSDEEDAEHDQDPPETADQRRAEPDEQRPEGKCAEDAPEQHPMLIFERDGERGEKHRPHEHVVHRKRLLDQIARDVLAEGLAAERRPDDCPEREAAGHPDHGFTQRLFGAGLVIVSVADEIDREHQGNESAEAYPGPQRNRQIDEVSFRRAGTWKKVHGSLRDRQSRVPGLSAGKTDWPRRVRMAHRTDDRPLGILPWCGER